MKQHTSDSRRNFLKVSSLAGLSVLATPLLSHATTSNNHAGPDDGKNDFFAACKRGDLATVQTHVEHNKALLAAKDADGKSGFCIALLHHHQEISDWLKAAGYLPDMHESALDTNWERFSELYGEENTTSTQRVNEIHPMGGTVMWAAAAGGAGKDVWRVYAVNSDPNIRSEAPDSTSPLQKALEFPDLKTAEMTAASLLANNTNPNPAQNERLPPLHIAAQRGSIELVEMLIRLGADPEATDVSGRSALQLADYFGQEETYALLENHASIPRTCRTSRYAYDGFGKKYQRPDMTEFAAHIQGSVVGSAHRDLDGLKKQVEAHPLLVHAMATTSECAVEAGAHMGRPDIVEFLLESGAPYSLPTAVLMRDFSRVKKLLAEDSNRIYERGAHDFALLWYAIIGEANMEMAQLLLDHGAKVEEQHFLGTTALHWACFRGPLELVELLVESGADVNRVGRKFDPAGETPLQSAQDETIIRYLKSKGAK